MTSDAWKQAVEAMRTRRKELIAQPIDRIYGELLAAAFPILAEELVAITAEAADEMDRIAASHSPHSQARAYCQGRARQSRNIMEDLRARIDQMKERG